MDKQFFGAIILVCISCCSGATEETSLGEPDYLQYPYCFRFTWLGVKYNKDSIIGNATCSTLLEDATDVPCKRPLIATNNSGIPDTTWLWDQYKKSKPNEIACRLSRGDVCVKYSYIYDGAVQNITYMCAKVSVDGEGPVNSDCYMQEINGKEIEVCVCVSQRGQPPCNRAPHSTLYVLLLPTLILLYWFFVK